ncbi:MAG TPA: glycosyltransferase family 4 protein [Puia sp.]|nr:glycosyltransferase family 4 protein [Puia sp.]
MRKKLAIVISHPIQHFCPQYASLAAHPHLQIRVFFASALGYKKYVDPNFKQEIAWDNLRLDAFDHQFLNGEVVLPADKELDAEGLDEALTAFSPDLVIVHGYFQKLQRRAYRWARKNGVKLAYIADSERRQKRPAIKEWLKYPYLARYFSGIDIFLTVGDANEAYYRHYRVPSRKMVRMHFSIDQHLYQQAYPSRKELALCVRGKFGLNDKDLVLSVVGKLVSWKNQVDIVDAMKILEAKGIFLHLFVIGSGEDKELLEERSGGLSRSRVIFPGFVKPGDLPGYYAATDIYIHPAAIEPHSLAISEAIYMGCPVILSDRCGSYGENDDVQEGRNGLIFACGNKEELADKISSLVRDSVKREAFGIFSHQLGEKFQKRSHGGFVGELVNRLKK